MKSSSRTTRINGVGGCRPVGRRGLGCVSLTRRVGSRGLARARMRFFAPRARRYLVHRGWEGGVGLKGDSGAFRSASAIVLGWEGSRALGPLRVGVRGIGCVGNVPHRYARTWGEPGCTLMSPHPSHRRRRRRGACCGGQPRLSRATRVHERTSLVPVLPRVPQQTCAILCTKKISQYYSLLAVSDVDGDAESAALYT